MPTEKPAPSKPTKREQLERLVARLEGEKQGHQNQIGVIEQRLIGIKAQLAALPTNS